MRARTLALLVSHRAASNGGACLEVDTGEMHALVGRLEVRREEDFSGTCFRRQLIAPPMRQCAERRRIGRDGSLAVGRPHGSVVAEREGHAGDRELQLRRPLVGQILRGRQRALELERFAFGDQAPATFERLVQSRQRELSVETVKAAPGAVAVVAVAHRAVRDADIVDRQRRNFARRRGGRTDD